MGRKHARLPPAFCLPLVKVDFLLWSRLTLSEKPDSRPQEEAFIPVRKWEEEPEGLASDCREPRKKGNQDSDPWSPGLSKWLRA